MVFSRNIFLLLFLSSISGYAKEDVSHKYILLPLSETAEGITYLKALEILGSQGHISYGEPIQIEVNFETEQVDISSFDDIVVSVPMDSARVQPNRTEPTR